LKLLESAEEPIKEESESVTKCNRLKTKATDGKQYLTYAATPNY